MSQSPRHKFLDRMERRVAAVIRAREALAKHRASFDWHLWPPHYKAEYDKAYLDLYSASRRMDELTKKLVHVDLQLFRGIKT